MENGGFRGPKLLLLEKQQVVIPNSSPQWLLSPAVCGREHPAPVHEDTRALELEVMEEGDLPGLRVTRAADARRLKVLARGVSREQQRLRGPELRHQ